MSNQFLRLIQLLAGQGIDILNDDPSEEDLNDYIEERQSLDNEDITDIIISDTGCAPGQQDHSVHNLVNQREYHRSIRKPANRSLDYASSMPFGRTTQRHIMQRYFPNSKRLLKQSRDGIFCSLFSAQGDMFMSACKDSTITIYDTASWEAIRSVRARDIGWSIISTDFSPDGRWLIYSSWSDYVNIINTSGDFETHESLDMKPNGGRFCLFSSRFSPDSREILGGSSDGYIYIYDLDRRERIERIGHHVDDINAVAYADDSNQIFLSGSDDSLIKAWDRRIDGKAGCIGVFPGHEKGITYIDSKRDGRYFISNGKDQCIKLWDIRAMQNESDFQGRPTTFQYNHGNAFELNNTGERRLSYDKSVMTYYGPQKILQTLIRCKFSPAYSTGQKYIYTGSADGIIYIFDVLSGQLVGQLDGHNRCVRDMDWHPYLPMLASSSWDGTVKIWDFDENDDGDDGHVVESSSDDSSQYYF